MKRLARIGVVAGQSFDSSRLSPEMKTAFAQGLGGFRCSKNENGCGRSRFGRLFWPATTPIRARRYLRNSPMLPQFLRDADGGLTLLIQNVSPENAKRGKLAPSTKGILLPRSVSLLAKTEAVDGKWIAPPLTTLK